MGGTPFRILNLLSIGVALVGLFGCRPEVPVTSSITVDLSDFSAPVNEQLYGLTIEEINHAVDGGLYAEMIENRSFEASVPPLNCPYDARRNVLTTPNGWSIPFIRPDSIPGWRKLSLNTEVWLDAAGAQINDKNKRSLMVLVSASHYSSGMERGGVAATGYNGISVRKGEKYELSLYMKGGSMVPKDINVFIGDSATGEPLSDIFKASPIYEWRRYRHTFTANESRDNAVLAITADTTSSVFWIDMVSLFPQNTWKGRQGGLRQDLMEMIAALNPKFIRFPGGSFVEGYTAGTFPLWQETIGDNSMRRNFWNVWGYASTSGMGFHEYLQMCEDLNAEPVYVVNSGVTSQKRRPRYEDITAMDKMVQDALDAIAYANQPADSTWGAMRARSGHTEPFGLKYIEVGSENYGQEYSKRFELFKKAIKEAYPEVTVIRSSSAGGKRRTRDWIDHHFYAGEDFMIAGRDRYDKPYSWRFPEVFIGEFSLSDPALQGTMRAAVAEACFLLGAESAPVVVKGLAYAPVLGNADYPFQRYPAISFNNHRAVGSPSYYMLKMLANNRGDGLLKTKVETYSRPQVALGYVGIDLFDNSYDFEDVRLDGHFVKDTLIRTGGWKVSGGTLMPEANKWNNILLGDPSNHDYTLSLRLRRNKGSGSVRLRVRDNGKEGEANNHIALSISPGECELYSSMGTVKDVLSPAKAHVFESNRWYEIKIVCRDETLSCYVDNVLLHEVTLPPLPSLVSVATMDNSSETILLKVVNTTYHEEKTHLNINGGSVVKHEVEVVQLAGEAKDGNTFEEPLRVVPTTQVISFPIGQTMVYTFPPNSITILKLKKD